MSVDQEDRLLAKLAQIEALHAGAASDGERNAAAAARERIKARLREVEKTEPPIPFQLSIHDPWERQLFCAFVRRYDLTPYREHGQRRTTIMVNVPRRFMEGTLWPQFRELATALRAHLAEVTKRVIAQAIHEDDSDGEDAPHQLPDRAADAGARRPA